MRLVYKSWIYKVFSVCRFIVIKIYYRGKFQCPNLSMIGKNCGIHIFKKGKILCKERVIVDDNVMLFAKGELHIGKRFGINQYSRIVAHEKIARNAHQRDHGEVLVHRGNPGGHCIARVSEMHRLAFEQDFACRWLMHA